MYIYVQQQHIGHAHVFRYTAAPHNVESITPPAAMQALHSSSQQSVRAVAGALHSAVRTTWRRLLLLLHLLLRVLLQELSLQDHIDAVRVVGLSATQMQWIADGFAVFSRLLEPVLQVGVSPLF
jgi:hypothetical protein